ncbi:MAG: NAD(P)-dependent oxidoreductase [Fibrella sp.]|nr:NAD(P)-dependent oxidoreductase [Armatimonadota bacterium]
MSEVSVIGLGAMGLVLARTLLDHGHRVTVWNRTGTKAESLVQAGARIAPDISAAFGASPTIIVCVTDYNAARSLLETEEATNALSGKVLIQLTTGTPQDARDGEDWARKSDIAYLDGAIMAIPSQVGRPDTTIFVSGSKMAFQKSEPLLRVLAGNLQYMGEAVSAAAAWDLAVLSHLFGGLLGFYHGARIFESEGIRVDALGSVMSAMAPVIGEMVLNDSNTIQAEEYTHPESSLEICWKGLELVRKHAQESQINSEFPTFAAALFHKGMIAGYGDEKAPALIKVLRQSA